VARPALVGITSTTATPGKETNIVIRKPTKGVILSLTLLGSLASLPASAQISYTGPAYTQDFDTLANTGTANTWTDNVTLLGWFSNRTTYRASAGGDNAGSLYSLGAAASTERALGSIASGSATPVFGVQIQNNTGTALTNFTLSFTGEQWRDGGAVAAVLNTLDFAYSLDATSLTSGTYIDVNSLDFTGPKNSNGTATALDGNLGENQVAKSATVSLDTPLAAGSSIWLRWSDFNDVGNDHALGIDNLSFSGAPVPGPSALAVFALGGLAPAMALLRKRRAVK
jgi:hypothetical protein